MLIVQPSVVNSILEAAATGIKTNSTEDNIDDQDTFRELASQTYDSGLLSFLTTHIQANKEKQAFASQPLQRNRTAKKVSESVAVVMNRIDAVLQL